MNFRTYALRLTALILVAAVPLASAAPAGSFGLNIVGALSFSGPVKVNGSTVISGQTLISGSTIDTGRSAAAVVSLGTRGRVELLASTRLVLNLNDSDPSKAGLTGALEAGRARVFVPEGISVSFAAEGGTVVADSALPAAFSIEAEDGTLFVAVLAGRVFVHTNEGRTLNLEAGQSASAGSNSQTQTARKNSLSRRKLAAILLPVGGAIALIALVFARDKNSNDTTDSFGGCVTILSPVAGCTCC